MESTRAIADDRAVRPSERLVAGTQVVERPHRTPSERAMISRDDGGVEDGHDSIEVTVHETIHESGAAGDGQAVDRRELVDVPLVEPLERGAEVIEVVHGGLGEQAVGAPAGEQEELELELLVPVGPLVSLEYQRFAPDRQCLGAHRDRLVGVGRLTSARPRYDPPVSERWLTQTTSSSKHAAHSSNRPADRSTIARRIQRSASFHGSSSGIGSRSREELFPSARGTGPSPRRGHGPQTPPVE